jgi:hypothetical protein
LLSLKCVMVFSLIDMLRIRKTDMNGKNGK